MLVLSRKKNESIVIGDDIIIIVVEASKGKTRLGIEARGDVPVHREEIFLSLQKSGKQFITSKSKQNMENESCLSAS